MSADLDALRAVGIFNPHNAATGAASQGGVGVYLSYRPRRTGRAYQSAAWQVVDPRRATNPDGHWQDYGHKTFDVFHARDRAAQETAAMAWASALYGVTDWAKVPGLPAAWFPAEDAALIRALARGGAS